MVNMLNSVKSNPYLLVKIANKGLNASNLNDLYILTKHDKKFFAEVLLISPKTIDRYIKEDKKFNASESEKLIKLKELYEKGIEVFGNVEEFNTWIEKPAFGIGNMVPKELMQMVSGINLVMNELINIEFGSLA